MKLLTRLLLACILLSFGWVEVAAQNKDSLDFKGFKTPVKGADLQNVIKSSPFPIFVGSIPLCGELRINYERMITYNQSFVIGGSYNYPNLMLMLFSAVSHQANGFNKLSVRGGRIMLGYRYYPLKSVDAPAGLFLGPYFSYDVAKIKERGVTNGDTETFHYLNADFIAGYQIDVGSNVYIEFMGGLGYRKNYDVQYDARNDKTTVSDIYFLKAFKNFKVLLQYNIGLAF